MDRPNPFFRPGGTLDPFAQSYIVRAADEQLLSSLLRGEYVFLLDSRQKGKSSLVARTILRLREQGVRTVKLDLQRIGSNVTPDQWYAGLLQEIGQELGVVEHMFSHWGETQHIGPLARLVGALGIAVAAVSEPVVLFVDEIDFVRALPFSADEFFAAIRDCYNRRSESDTYGRLTFCLVGVATPSQLIQNPEITPFNIGRRIDLSDFSEFDLHHFAEALDMAGLPGKQIISRIHYWVCGHPYLSQALCAVALELGAETDAHIDSIVSERLIAPEQRQRDPNLADVERRMLEPLAIGFEPDDARSRVLEVLSKLLKKQSVGIDFDDPSIATLLLAGVAKDEHGRLVIRNRVYEQVFNERWRQASLPGAERRRQRAAFQRGALRVGVIAGAGLLLIGTLTIRLAVLAAERDRALNAASGEANRADRAAYVRTMALMELEARDNRWMRVRQLFDGVAGSRHKGWEYGYWFRKLNEHVASCQLDRRIRQLALSPDSSIIASLVDAVEIRSPALELLKRLDAPGGDCTISNSVHLLGIGNAGDRNYRVLGLPSFREVWTGQADANAGRDLPFLVDSSGDLREVYLYLLQGNLPVLLDTYPMPKDYLHGRVSRSGRYLVLINVGSARLIDRVAKSQIDFSENFFSTTNTIIFNRSETKMWVGASTNHIKEIALPSGKETRQLGGYQAGVYALQLDPSETMLLSASGDSTTAITDLQTGARRRTFLGHVGNVMAAAWSLDGRFVYTGSSSGELRKYDLNVPPPLWKLQDHRGQVGRVLLNRDASRMITQSEDGTCKLYDVPSRRLIKSIDVPGAPPPGQIKLSPDEGFAFAGGLNGEVVCFAVNTGRVVWRSPQSGAHVSGLAVSTDGEVLIVGNAKGLVSTLDARLGTVLRSRALGIKPVRGCVFSPDGTEVALGCWYDLHILRTDTLATVRSQTGSAVEGDVRSLSLSQHGKRLLLAKTQLATELNWSDLTVTQSFAGHTGRIFAARYTGSGKSIYTFGLDGRVRVVNRATGRLLIEVAHDSWVSAVEVTSDDSRLITSSDDGTIRLWSIASGEQVTTLAGSGSTIFNFAVSRDEAIIATAAQDGSVFVYFGLPAAQLGAPDRK